MGRISPTHKHLKYTAVVYATLYRYRNKPCDISTICSQRMSDKVGRDS